MIGERRTARSVEVIELNDLVPPAAPPLRRRLDRHPGAPGCRTSPVSRRHHGGRPHRSGGAVRHEPTTGATNGGDRFAPPAGPSAAHAPTVPATPAARLDAVVVDPQPSALGEAPLPGGNGSVHPAPDPTERPQELADAARAGHADTGPNGANPVNGAVGAHEVGRADHDAAASCTAPQLRRFIKSRPYVPMHELRRRFGINGHDDDVTPVDLGRTRVYVGLPHREGSLLGELLRGGEIGYELSLDPHTPVVVGLYPMRPIARS
jgi:hypothetical protein